MNNQEGVPTTRRERVDRAGRLVNPRVWRSLLLGVTEPTNDWHWAFINKRDTAAYLDSPEPWLAEGAAAMLGGYVTRDTRVLEWGAGASTLWFVGAGAEVTAIETDPDWVANLEPLVRGRATSRQCRARTTRHT